MSRTDFGTMPDGRSIESFRLRNGRGISVGVLTLGGIIQSVLMPDRDGMLADIALGYSTLADYLVNAPYFGAIIGRCANRIANAEVAIDGKNHKLAANLGPDMLHGGAGGFHKKVWSVDRAADDHLALSLDSPDGDEGFPGALHVHALYLLSGDALALEFTATTTEPTIVNLGNHAYWNLAGADAGNVLDHALQIDADAFTPVDARLIPTGEIRPVAGTPFDFREPCTLKPRVTDSTDAQIAHAGGIDANFVLSSNPGGALRRAARLADPASGRVLEVFTTEPGLQVYTGNGLAGGPPGKTGEPYERWGGIALETQHFPDAPHHPNFPSIVLRPGEKFRSSTVFRFSIDWERRAAS